MGERTTADVDLGSQSPEFVDERIIKAVLDGALASVKVDFDPPEYSMIADAHDRRLSVSLEGDLRRDGQRWHLMNPRDLTIIEDDE